MAKKGISFSSITFFILLTIIFFLPLSVYAIETTDKDSINFKTSSSRPLNAKSIIRSAPPASDEEIIEYVREVWNIVDLTDETIKELSYTEYRGILFKDWISFFIEVPWILEPLQNGDYAEASKQGARLASKGLFNKALSDVGFSGVASIASLAYLPIEFGISAFKEAANDNAFEIQRQYYFQAREHNSFETILNADPFELLEAGDIPISKDGEGWFFRQNGLGSQAPAVPNFTAEQFIRLAELQWKAEHSNYESDNEQVRDAFLNTDGGDGGSPPDNQTLALIEIEDNNGYQSIPANITLNGSQSHSTEEIVSYEWSFGDGNTATGETVDHVFYSAGRNSVTLTITDDAGNEDQVMRDIYFSAPTFTVSPQTLHTSQFTAQASGNITGYSWDFGDGSTANGRQVEHTFDVDGEYTVELTFTFNSGESTTVSKNIYAGPRPVYVSGAIESDHRWAAAYGPYLVSEAGLDISEGAILTIDPGAIVKFRLDYEADLNVSGTLKAEGTEADSIIFTSFRDDTYGGDTNGDGNESSPSPGDWDKLAFYETSSGVLNHIVVRYGGYFEGQSALSIDGVSPSVTNSRFNYNNGDGIHVHDGSESAAAPLIENNKFTNNNQEGISVSRAGPTIRDNAFVGNKGSAISVNQSQNQNSPAPIIAGNTLENNLIGIKLSGSGSFNIGSESSNGNNIFIDNTNYAVRNNSSDSVQAIGNYWGDTNTSVIDSQIYDDNEDSNSGPVIFEPFLEEPPTDDDGGLEQPAIPTGLTATNNNGNIELSWDANTEQDLAGYNLYRSTSLFSDPTVANKINDASLITEETYTDDNIEASTTYYYRLTSVNSNGNESPLSSWVSYVNEALNISNEWKLISNPTLQEKNLPGVEAFRFDRTYQRDSVLTAGKGYWIKSNTDKDLAFQDQGIDSIAIELDQGWNLVGSLVDTIHTADIDDPGSVIGSAPVYSYDINSGNYQEATQLFPKKGYWLYAEESGNIHLSFNSDEQNTKEKPSQITGNEIVFDKIVFEHANSKQQLLYSNNPLNKQRYLLPPVPPQPYLDVRTSGSLKATGTDKTSLAISSSTYPVQVSLEKHQDNNVVYQLSAHEGKDKVLLTLTSANSLQIKESYEQISINRISESEVPLENKLLPNYPNPFNPTTTIKYEVANTSNVEIKVYDVLGRKVRTLVNQQRQPGVYTTNFNGGDLASGLYFIKINAGQYAKVQKMTLIK